MEKSPRHGKDWLEAGLLFLLIQVTAARLVTTGWAMYLYMAESVAALGTLLGLALGVSRFPRRTVLWFVLDYTLVFFPWQMTGVVDTPMPYWDRMVEVGDRLLVSLGQFLQRQPVDDSFFFVACVSLGFWLISLAAGYWLMRHNNVLVAIIPAGFAILLIQVYDNFYPRRTWWLAVFIFITLLLLGREYYLRSRMEWVKRRVVVNEEAWTDIFGGLLTTITVTVVLAWIVPTSLPSLQSAADTWNKLTKPILDEFSNAVTSLNTTNVPGGGVFYGDTLPLGFNAATGDSVALSIKVLNGPETPIRYYWRGRVYENYTHGQWFNPPATHLDFKPADANLIIPD